MSLGSQASAFASPRPGTDFIEQSHDLVSGSYFVFKLFVSYLNILLSTSEWIMELSINYYFDRNQSDDARHLTRPIFT